MSNPNNPCIFCKIDKKNIIFENDYAYASYDSYPVSKFHSLIIPKRHISDFFELKDTDEFLEWLEDQPSSIADGVLKNSTDSKWAIRVLDLYKSDKGLVKKQSRRSKKSAEAAEFIATKDKVVAEGKNERIWTVSEISRLKPHEFDKYEKEIDKASREGRITNQ